MKLPPKFADRLLESFCAPELLEEVQGDLHELYGKWIAQYGKGKANRLYYLHVVKFFRPFALKRKKYQSINNTAMIKNYLKIGVRNILKYKTFSFINVFGLAVAMAVCMIIILMLADQKSYDQFHENKERAFRIISEPKDTRNHYATTPVPLARTLGADYPMIETSTQLIQGVAGDATYQQNSTALHGFFADPGFFNVFSFELEKGNAATALSAPNSMVVTHEVAEKIFKNEDPVGKTIEFADRSTDSTKVWGLYTITGVIADKHYKSHLDFDVLVSNASLPALYAAKKVNDMTQDWANYYNCYTYVVLYPEQNQAALDGALQTLGQREYADMEDQKGFSFSAQPLTTITLGPILSNDPKFSLPLAAYYILGGLALIIMLSACLNYTNLSIARALTRAKEIGVRKITGALRKDLVYQFLSESLLTTFVALGLALVLLVFLKPAFTNLWLNQHLKFELQENLTVYAIFLSFAILIGLIAGFYPAMYLSGFRPLQVLKNMDSTRPGKLGMRKILSTSQFVISLIFIITSLLIYNQFKYFLAFDYGFASESIINVPLQGNKYELVANELNQVSGVSEISASEYIPSTGTNNGNSLRKAGTEDEFTFFNSLPVDPNFISNLDIELIAGSNLPETSSASDQQILVNEAAAKVFGFDNPAEMVGMVLDGEWSEKDYEVIGVIKDFQLELPMAREEIRPMLLINQPDHLHYANIKIAHQNLIGTVENLEAAWKKIDPVHPFEYEFYDQQLESNNQAILDIVSIIGFIALLAIIIACLGMLGMVTYTTERRIKEIGIRKVLGAENFSITILLSRSFLKILGAAVLIGAPMSYFLNNLWLQHFPNRVHFGWATLLAGSLLLLGLGLLTVGSQTIRASRRNPVETLQHE